VVFGFSPVQLKTYTIAVLALIVAYLLLRQLVRRLNRKLPASTSTWKFYLRGQGTLLLGFLFVGGIMASVFSYFGPRGGKTSKEGRLIEYQVDPSEHVVYEEQDVENYHRITVLARTISPQNGSATVTIYDDPKGRGKQEISRMESIADSWSEWSQPQNSSKHITLKITNGGTGPGAKLIDVKVYLFPE
jgi:hypothetical protein